MTCSTVSSAPRKETSAPTSYHHASTLCASTATGPTTSLRYGAEVSRAACRYLSSWPWLALYWLSGEPAPMAMLELLSCQCKRRCQLPNCTCLSNGLQCTDLCRLQDCANRHENPTEAIAETDDDDDD